MIFKIEFVYFILIMAFIYCRVSSEKQSRFNEGHISLQTQEAVCREYCDKNGLVVTKVVTEVGSARNMDKLVAQKKLIRGLKENSVLFVYDISRFSRNVLQGLILLNKLKQRKVNVRSVIDGCSYIGTIAERHLFNTSLCFTEHQSNTISENIKRNVAHRRTLGHKIGKAPYGFMSCRTATNVRIFKKNDEEQQVIEYICKCNKDYMSATTIATTLNEKELLRRGKEWTYGSVRNIILKYDHISMKSIALPVLEDEELEEEQEVRSRGRGRGKDEEVQEQKPKRCKHL